MQYNLDLYCAGQYVLFSDILTLYPMIFTIFRVLAPYL